MLYPQPARRADATGSPVPERTMPPQSLTNLQSKVWEISTKLAGSIGFGGMVNGAGSTSLRVLCVDVTATIPYLYETTTDAGVMYSIQGVGFRVCVTVSNTTATAGLNLDDLAASISGSSSSARMQVQTFGLLPETNEALQPFDDEAFGISFFEHMTRGCTALGRDIASRVDDMHVYHLEEIAPPVHRSPFYYRGVSTSCAIHGISKGRSANQQAQRVIQSLKSHNTKSAYGAVSDFLLQGSYVQAGSTDPSAGPSDSVKSTVNAITNQYHPKN